MNVRLRGKVVPGLREAAGFTQLDWVRSQMLEKFAMDPYPGTLNLEIEDPDSLRIWEEAQTRATITLDPPDPAFCQAICIPAVLAGRIDVVALIPHVDSYPRNKIELLAPCHVKQTLGVGDDAELELELRHG